jgi:hypothetical protein
MQIASDPERESLVIDQALRFANLRPEDLPRYVAELDLPPETPRKLARYQKLLTVAFTEIMEKEIPDDDELVGDGPLGHAALFMEDGVLTVLDYEVPTVAALVMLSNYFLRQPYWIDRLRRCPSCREYFIRQRRKQADCGDPDCKKKRIRAKSKLWDLNNPRAKIKKRVVK